MAASLHFSVETLGGGSWGTWSSVPPTAPALMEVRAGDRALLKP